MHRKRHYSSPQAGQEPKGVVEWILPASLSFYQAQENLLLQNMVSEVNGYLMQFKLAPAYGLYMVVKHHLSPDFQPSSSSSDRRKYLILALKNIIAQIKRAVKVFGVCLPVLDCTVTSPQIFLVHILVMFPAVL